ncbi:class II fructose-bisphosphate aldolase [Marispirochaeta aestuarii]|uniref:class II fructose-bisphosphate aldolase n=1 Tax=Marispirochaeta aestuarii TaxID=1963862 RepID=UPI0029C82CCC|nr:class II fructose-bisphosphate aldolase [Marispirochaeta aestuarii]
MLINCKEMLEQSRGAIASFNCVDFEMARACLEAGEEARHPVIIGIAVRHWKALGGRLFIPSIRSLCVEADIPAALHLDHAGPEDLDIIDEALDSGFSSVMIDASRKPFAANVEVTRGIVQRARLFNASVEAELGPLPGDEGVAGLVDTREAVYTDPQEAGEFCAETGVDALAVAVGTAHGLYTAEPEIQQELISRIARETGVPLVLHGATGVPDEAIREAVRRGVKKINYFSGLLVDAMDVIRRERSSDDNDYLRHRSELREAWKRRAGSLIQLYSGHSF